MIIGCPLYESRAMRTVSRKCAPGVTINQASVSVKSAISAVIRIFSGILTSSKDLCSPSYDHRVTSAPPRAETIANAVPQAPAPITPTFILISLFFFQLKARPLIHHQINLLPVCMHRLPCRYRL